MLVWQAWSRVVRKAWLAVLALAAGCGPPPASGPDLVLITVDTLRPDWLPCYGGAADTGGAMCGVVGVSGVRYEWAFSTAPATAPSIGSVLTSSYPSEHRLFQVSARPIRDDIPALPELLSQAGYRTAAFVSNPALGRARGLHRGFDLYDDEMPRRDPDRPGLAERAASDATDAALAWIRRTPPPWFLWVHYQDPHGPYDPPGDEPLPEDPPGAPQLPVLRDASGWKGIPNYQALPGLRSEASYRARYAAEIRFLDRQVARLLDGVAAASPRHGTLLTADHGEAFGEDGYYFAHGHSVALDQIRVPLLWRPPGFARAGVVSTPVSLIDVAPTLLAAAGLPAPPAFRGRPLPLSGGAADATGRPLFSEHSERLAVVFDGRYLARDLRNLRGVRDRNSGGLLHPLPPRTAELRAGDAFPVYQRPDAGERDAGLVAMLAAFARDRAAPPAPTPLDEEMRERLRALGYVENDS